MTLIKIFQIALAILIFITVSLTCVDIKLKNWRMVWYNIASTLVFLVVLYLSLTHD